jgi:hypothetical protein
LHGHKHSGAVAVVESLEDEDEAAEVNAVQLRLNMVLLSRQYHTNITKPHSIFLKY